MHNFKLLLSRKAKSSESSNVNPIFLVEVGDLSLYSPCSAWRFR